MATTAEPRRQAYEVGGRQHDIGEGPEIGNRKPHETQAAPEQQTPSDARIKRATEEWRRWGTLPMFSRMDS